MASRTGRWRSSASRTAGKARFSGLARESGFDLARLDGDRVFAMLHGLVLEEEGVSAPQTVPPGAVPHPQEAMPPEAAPLASVSPETASGTRAVAGLDVAQVRAEIAQLRPETAPQAAASPHRPAGARGATEAALSVLKAALASERQRTAELRAEIDALRVTLAASEDRIEALRDARDLWAGRAGPARPRHGSGKPTACGTPSRPRRTARPRRRNARSRAA
ncbi:hypothetical protein ACRBEV_03425 [Methylobacterium phyllosphaerae]